MLNAGTPLGFEGDPTTQRPLKGSKGIRFQRCLATQQGYKAWVIPGRRVTDSLGRVTYRNGLAVAVKARGCCQSLSGVRLDRYTGHLGDLLLMEICGRGVAFLWQRPSAVQEGGLCTRLQSATVLHPDLVCLGSLGDWNDEPGP